MIGHDGAFGGFHADRPTILDNNFFRGRIGEGFQLACRDGLIYQITRDFL